MAGEVARLPKPNLRGLLTKQIGINLAVTGVLMTVAAIAYKLGVNDVRKAKYAEYYRTLDNNDLFQKMKAAGVFNSVPK